ncbi:plastocyanin/azurin family copper-binding protein [Speluncibacter jeojiensis]|uniref:Plastocyanin/azurin family copper-binding protein n=1 Tax=Speluncibacter jeojiensis TaxID=2710754 RepID=A0A9X4M133_9ACTN|nr:plastocyanin/azurin family copper-binding protein [Corynebacteriales bacterium D3-21]
MRNTLGMITVGAALLLGGTACGSTHEAQAPSVPTELPPNTVLVRDMQFTPAHLTVKAGQTVTWKFDDQGIPHDVTGTGQAAGILKSSTIANGTFSYVFKDPGTYDYMCSLHPQMTASVTVVP